MNEHSNEYNPAEVAGALQRLREADAEACAPTRLESGLREAFRAKHSHPIAPSRRGYYAWVAGAIAASLGAVGIWRLAQMPTVKAPEPAASQAVAIAKEPLTQPAPTASKVENAPVRKMRKPGTVQKAARAAVRSPEVQRTGDEPVKSEVATEFFALPFAPTFTAGDEGQVVRVRLPRTSMMTLGLPVDTPGSQERVKADVLLGQDGIVRAIRFVR